MREFVLSGRAVDVVLAVIVLEAIVLTLRRPAGLRRRAFVDCVFALAPGALLLLAVRAALTEADWPWIALLIAASFPFHLVDLRRRGI